MTGTRTALSRRQCLRRLATVVGVGVAGCTGTDDDGSGPDPGGTTDGGTGTGTRIGTGIGAGSGSDPTTTGTEGTGTPIHAGYETTAVRATTPNGDVLGSVTAAIADAPGTRYRGLSDTDSLPEDRGMLFVFPRMDDRTFVMRGMDFGIDIVYADGEGVITRIHQAPAPGPNENGTDQRYPGRGQYVLEVAYGWTTDRGVEPGDVLEFDL